MVRPTWPTKTEYDVAMQALDETVHDDEIRSGTLARNALGIIHYGGASLYTCLYRVDDWMVRCFCSNPPQEPPEDITERYQCIARFYHDNQEKVSALLPTYYIDPGIDVPLRGHDQRIIALRTFPLVKMRFLKAPKLGDFIDVHYQEKSTMEALSQAWLKMVSELEDAHMAHGDLDLTNVLVAQEGANLTLKLIDYDNVWIPALGDEKFKQTEHGHPSFQHPAYSPHNDRPYDAQMDRFAALVMYISLRALAVRPELYDKFGADDTHQLLLSANDFRKEYAHGQTRHSRVPDSHIERLYHVGIEGIKPYLDELRRSLSTGHMPARLDSMIPQKSQVQSHHSLPVFLWDDNVNISSSQIQPQLLPPQQLHHSLPVFLWNDRVDSEPSSGQPGAPQPQSIPSGSNRPEGEALAPPPWVQPIESQPKQRFPVTQPEGEGPPSRVQAEPPPSKETIRDTRQELEAPAPRTQANQKQPQPVPPAFIQQDTVGGPAHEQPKQSAQPGPIFPSVRPPAVDANIPIEDWPTGKMNQAGPPRSFPLALDANIPVENQPTQARPPRPSAADANAPTEPMPQIVSPPASSLAPRENIPLAPINASPVEVSPSSAQVQQGQVGAVEQDKHESQGSNEAREILIGAIFFIILFLAIAAIIVLILWRVGILHLGMIFPPSNPSAHASVPLATELQAAFYLFPAQYLCLPPDIYRRLLR